MTAKFLSAAFFVVGTVVVLIALLAAMWLAFNGFIAYVFGVEVLDLTLLAITAMVLVGAVGSILTWPRPLFH